MPTLLIDNSNTRTKFALATRDEILDWRAMLPTADVSPRSLENLSSGLSFNAVCCCSVVPAKAAILSAFFAPIAPTHFLSHESPLGVGIDYPVPSQIGPDRLANAAGLVHAHSAPAIVIDFGTATTFDIIDATPSYIGGVIAPGLGAVRDYLPSHTALLPHIELTEPTTAIGKSTEQAMLAGTIHGYRGMIREILGRIQAELGLSPAIIATGGDASLIARGLPEIQAIDPLLTLEGLRVVAARVFTRRMEG